ncbi:histone deacetylase family protein [Rhodovarius crocodyli]|uniref:Histone deacetylase family protein n=2 Tax=Rhodovarius crocodyli TaxID=1979269 RepID=A0A437M1U6_9PROT|nr:histone deacetylase family protein [Rhodovarius crocodyli]
MRVFLPPGHARHDPDRIVGSGMAARPYFERPGRVEALLRALRAKGLAAEAPRDHGTAPIAAVHDAGYLAFLERAYEEWRAQPGREYDLAVRPNAFAVRPLHRRPTNIAGLAGWYLSGHGAPVLEHSWSAALSSAHAAIDAADAVLGGDPQAYALTRPPGHHAHADLAGGFCFLNNAAIAAERLRQGGVARVGILDIDVHHGNGTQAIFYEREDVHFVSVHSDPAGLYPFYAGYADEVGAGHGTALNLNIPLPAGATDSLWLDAVERGLDAYVGIDTLVVSLGFDAQRGDPTANLAVTADGFRGAGQRIAALGLPTVLIQEGGYLIETLEANLAAFLDGFFGARATQTQPLEATP